MFYAQAFCVLGIPITKDAAAIKQAYLKQLPEHHPEVDPEGFMYLHQAYKAALAYAQGTGSSQSAAFHTPWQPDRTRSGQAETEFDRLFSDLEKEEAIDISRQKEICLGYLRHLRWYYLPIPRKLWQQFFSSEAFQLCRVDAECMDKLYSLLTRKIHTCRTLPFLLDQLWALLSFHQSEDLETLARKTRNCCYVLSRQYHHYLKQDPNTLPGRWILPALWYYEAFPFLPKALIIPILISLVFFPYGEGIIWLILGFYLLEAVIIRRKKRRQLGIYHPNRTDFLDGPTLFVIVFSLFVTQLYYCMCIADWLIDRIYFS